MRQQLSRAFLCLLFPLFLGVCPAVFAEPPESYAEQFNLSPWSTSVARAWAGVFRGNYIAPDATVVEVAPGQSPKVGVGLKMARPDFRGTLYVVEPTEKSLAAITAKYKTLFPDATIVGVPKLLTEIKPGDIPQGAFLTANHPMDDFITGSVIARLSPKQQEDFQKLFEAMYDPANEQNDVVVIKKIWDWLEAHPEVLADIKKSVIGDWKGFIDRFAPRNVAIAQYPSKFNTAHGLAAADRHARSTLDGLMELLPGKSPVARSHLESAGHNSDEWLVATTRPLDPTTDGAKRPGALKRLGADLFVPEQAHRLDPNSVSLLAVNPDLAVHLFGERARDPAWLKQAVLANYAIDTQPGEAPTTGEKVTVWADKQADGPNRTKGISMSGNRGSGRAAYTGELINVKGLPTSLIGPNAKPGHRNGRESTLISLQEYLMQNGMENLGAENNQILAVIDLNRTAEFDGFGENPTSLIVRVDGGTMDRPSHLFEAGAKDADVLEIARRFGIGDAKRFIHRIVHGAWSSGNISLQGGILDAETVSSVPGRGPVHSRTRKFEHNWFGREGLGQLEILGDLVEAKGDPTLAAPARTAFADARSKEMVRQFLHLMGLRADETSRVLSNPKLKAQAVALVNQFENLSTRIFPDYAALFPKTEDKSGLPIFDFSRFLRHYSSRDPKAVEQGFTDLFNRDGSLTPTAPRKPLPEAIERFVVKDASELEALKKQGQAFVADFDGLMRELVEKKVITDAAETANRAFVINGDSPYLEGRRARKIVANLLERRSAGQITDAAFRETMERVRRANIRIPERSPDGSYLSQVRLFDSGETHQVVDRQGKHRLVFLPFGSKVPATATLTIPGSTLPLVREGERLVSLPLSAEQVRLVEGLKLDAPVALDGVALVDLSLSPSLSPEVFCKTKYSQLPPNRRETAGLANHRPQ